MSATDVTGWLTTAQIESGLRALQADRPDLCQVTTLDPPPTAGGPKIVMLRVASPVGAASKIPVLITGGLHAREWAPPDALLEFAGRLVRDGVGAAPTYRPNAVSYAPFTKSLVNEVLDPATGKLKRVATADPAAPFPRVTVAKSALKTIFDKLEMFFIPLVNVDGRTFSITGTTHGQQNWRKNRQPNAGASCIDGEGIQRGVGTDINRNFDVAWDITKYYSAPYLARRNIFGLPLVSVSPDPCPPAPTARAFEFAGTFHGAPGPESAPEAKRVADVIRNKNIRYMLDVHSALGRVLYPWGMAHPSTDPTKNYRNTNLDATPGPPAAGGRTADGAPTDAEFMSSRMQRALQTTAGRIRDGIRHMRSTDARRAAEPQLDSEYVPMPGVDLYPTTGTSHDYCFTRQYPPPLGPSFVASEARPTRLTFALECGKAEEGGEHGFFPSRALEYPKIAREVHMACWALLSYAAAPSRDATADWPIKTG